MNLPSVIVPSSTQYWAFGPDAVTKMNALGYITILRDFKIWSGLCGILEKNPITVESAYSCLQMSSMGGSSPHDSLPNISGLLWELLLECCSPRDTSASPKLHPEERIRQWRLTCTNTIVLIQPNTPSLTEKSEQFVRKMLGSTKQGSSLSLIWKNSMRHAVKLTSSLKQIWIHLAVQPQYRAIT